LVGAGGDKSKFSKIELSILRCYPSFCLHSEFTHVSMNIIYLFLYNFWNDAKLDFPYDPTFSQIRWLSQNYEYGLNSFCPDCRHFIFKTKYQQSFFKSCFTCLPGKVVVFFGMQGMNYRWIIIFDLFLLKLTFILITTHQGPNALT
jgi:hypothetical protein